MKEYFALQYRMTNRRIRESGVEPIFAYIILIIGFYGLSFFMFKKTEFAEYIYMFFAVNFIAKLSETKRIEFLKLCFRDGKFKKIRLAENLICALPFLCFLIYRLLFIDALLLFSSAIILAFVNLRTKLNYTIVTPFSKRPFEFTVGYRNTYYLFFIAYSIAFISVKVNNFNLGVFSLIIVFAIILSFYLTPENEYYVWTYSMNARKYLLNKIKIAIIFSSTLTAPIIILLSIYFQQNIGLLLLFFIAGLAFLILIIGTKYSDYPKEISTPKGFLFALCFWFPPMLLILIPYMFIKSEDRLKNLLK